MLRYSPSTKYVVRAEIEYAKAPILEIISIEVKIIPASERGETSLKPTVETVITVM